jgi:hypothetical protein
VTCLYSADRQTCVTGAPQSLQNLEFSGSSMPHDPHDSSSCCQCTATVLNAVHVSIVSPLLRDVSHIAAISETEF